VFNVVLVEPEIPPNTGNIIRLCANTGAQLHLVEPLGFPLEDAKLKRAGLDYHEYASMQVHANWSALIEKHHPNRSRMFAFTTRGARRHDEVEWQADDWLIFGSETRGLSLAFLRAIGEDQWLRVPMQPVARSLNLSNAVAVAVYEAWRQHDFKGSGGLKR
jgi:tRNA (cytidine/uridine-2'-O-)-methyltransferase